MILSIECTLSHDSPTLMLLDSSPSPALTLFAAGGIAPRHLLFMHTSMVTLRLYMIGINGRGQAALRSFGAMQV